MILKKTAALFPTFGCKYLGCEQRILSGISGDLHELTARAEAAVPFDREEFMRRIGGDFTDELQSRYAAYIISCALSNILKRSRVHIACAAGYGMGLYAALFHAESVTFEQGLDLITASYEMTRKAAAGLDFVTGMISGLDEEDVSSLAGGSGEIEIINVNNRLHFMIGGSANAVARALAAAVEMGAIDTGLSACKQPYHTRIMEPVAREFYNYCSRMRIYDPGCRIISALDSRGITTWEEAVSELSRIINCNANWRGTMESIIASGVDAFVECGPGKSLYRIARFIEGAFRVYHLNTIQELLSSDRSCVSDGTQHRSGV